MKPSEAAPSVLFPSWASFAVAGVCFAAAGYVLATRDSFLTLYAELGIAIPAVVELQLSSPVAVPLGLIVAGLGQLSLSRVLITGRRGQVARVAVGFGAAFLVLAACGMISANALVFGYLQHVLRGDGPPYSSLDPLHGLEGLPEPAATDAPEPAPQVRPGDTRAQAIAALGRPDAEEDAQLRYHQSGVRVDLGNEERVRQVVLFGEARSDRLDANGNWVGLYEKDGRWYRPRRWRVQGVTVGTVVGAALETLGPPDRTEADVNGRRSLHYDERGLAVELDAGSPEKVVAFRLGDTLPEGRTRTRKPKSKDARLKTVPLKGGWADVEVGDTVGIGFNVGQILELDEETYRWRVWTNGAWAGEETGSREMVQVLRRDVALPSEQEVSFVGGTLQVRVQRTRTASTGGLRFKVELGRDKQGGVLLSGLTLRFHLGGLGPDGPATSESLAVDDVLLPGELKLLQYRVRDEGLLDGTVEVVVRPEEIVAIPTHSATAHLLRTIAEREEPRRLERAYQAAGVNGDRELCLLMIARHVSARSAKHREALLAGLQNSGDLAPLLILEALATPDAELERVELEGTTPAEVPLGQNATAHRRGLAELLAQLPNTPWLGAPGLKKLEAVFESQGYGRWAEVEEVQRTESVEAAIKRAVSLLPGGTRR